MGPVCLSVCLAGWLALTLSLSLTLSLTLSLSLSLTRPGRPHCFRLEVWETKDGWSQPAKDSQGHWKYVLDAETDVDKQSWMACINGAEPEAEPQPESE